MVIRPSGIMLPTVKRGKEFWTFQAKRCEIGSMGLRIRRSIQLFPGLRLNLGKTGVGISAGVRGLRVGVDSRGRKYGSVGIPGTGISYRETESTRQPASTGRRIVIKPLGWVVIWTAAAVVYFYLLLGAR